MPTATPINPIQNCPEDILRIIFEMRMEQNISVNPPNYRSAIVLTRHANTLASICSAWRTIAINTPKVWRNMVLSMDRPSERVLAYWTSMITRVKRVPVTIWIYKISHRSASSLSILNIPASLTVKLLHLDFLHPSIDPKSFPKVWRRHPFEKLSVDFRQWNVCNHFPVFHLGHLSGKVRSLIVYGPPDNLKIHLDGTKFASLVHLVLYRVKGIDLGKLFSGLPALETLVLDRCSAHQPSRIVKGPLLRSLRVEHYSRLDWISMVNFPKLESFSHHRQGHPRGNLGAFFKSHQGIRIFELEYTVLSGNNRVLEKLSQFTKRLSTLILHVRGWNVYWVNSITQPNFFPSLRTLGIIRRNGVISIEEFDEIVRARCLPISHYMNMATHESSIFDVFYIEIPVDQLGNTNWFESDLYMEATKKTVDSTDQAKRVYLAWSPGQHRALHFI